MLGFSGIFIHVLVHAFSPAMHVLNPSHRTPAKSSPAPLGATGDPQRRLLRPARHGTEWMHRWNRLGMGKVSILGLKMFGASMEFLYLVLKCLKKCLSLKNYRCLQVSQNSLQHFQTLPLPTSQKVSPALQEPPEKCTAQPAVSMDFDQRTTLRS